MVHHTQRVKNATGFEQMDHLYGFSKNLTASMYLDPAREHLIYIKLQLRVFSTWQ